MTTGAPAFRPTEVNVRYCHTLEDFEACMALEREVWGSAEIDVVPLPIFVVAAHTGGQVLGAYAGDRLVGFTLAMAGYRDGPFLHSHMTAVTADFRDRGVGRQLKLFQRQDALQRGIPRVEWTFDPLELKNAYFNLERLGAIVRKFIPNAYGITTSHLHSGLPTDRLLAEWWLSSRRAVRCAAGEPVSKRTGEVIRIEVPAQIGDLRRNQPDEAARIQANLREQFQRWLAKGYAATGIEIDAEKGTYLLEPLAVPQEA